MTAKKDEKDTDVEAPAEDTPAERPPEEGLVNEGNK